MSNKDIGPIRVGDRIRIKGVSDPDIKGEVKAIRGEWLEVCHDRSACPYKIEDVELIERETREHQAQERAELARLTEKYESVQYGINRCREGRKGDAFFTPDIQCQLETGHNGPHECMAGDKLVHWSGVNDWIQVMRQDGKVRLTIHLDKEDYAFLKKMGNQGSGTKADVMRLALSYYRKAQEHDARHPQTPAIRLPEQPAPKFVGEYRKS